MKRGALTFFYLVVLFLLFLIPTMVFADCTDVSNSAIKDSVTFCQDTYYLPSGLNIDEDANNIIIDCFYSVIIGSGGDQGIVIDTLKNITIKNCEFSNFHTGIMVIDSENITIESNKLSNNSNGIKVITSKNVGVNENKLTDNENMAINLVSCFNCEHESNNMLNNGQSMIIEYLCIGGDGVCPSHCNGTLDYDCNAICGDEVCTTEGDCDCNIDDIPLDEMYIEEDEGDEEEVVEEEITGDLELISYEDVETDNEIQNGYDDDSLIIPLNFEFEDSSESKAENLVDVIYPVQFAIDNEIPSLVFETIDVNENKHQEINDLLKFSKKMIVNEGETEVELTITPKKYIPLLIMYEYFPDNFLDGATEVSSESDGVKFSKKKQMAKIKLTRLKKNEEFIVSYSLDKEVLGGESYTIFYKAYPKRNLFIGVLVLLIVLMYTYFAFSIRPFLKKYEMYLHKHISERYLIISKEEILSLFIIFPIVALAVFFFEVTFKLLMGLWLLKFLVFVLFVLYLGLFLIMFMDMMDFKKRYHIKK
jgi:parallel beta-helix repeat protein